MWVEHPLPYRLLIFEADDVLRVCTVEGQRVPYRMGEWGLLPGVRQTLDRYTWDVTDGVQFGVASNQAEAGEGHVTYGDTLELLCHSARAACRIEAGAPAPDWMSVLMSPLRLDRMWHKPGPAMLWHLMEQTNCLPEETLMVGATMDDELAARRAHIEFEWAWRFFGWPEPDQLGRGLPTSGGRVATRLLRSRVVAG